MMGAVRPSLSLFPFPPTAARGSAARDEFAW